LKPSDAVVFVEISTPSNFLGSDSNISSAEALDRATAACLLSSVQPLTPSTPFCGSFDDVTTPSSRHQFSLSTSCGGCCIPSTGPAADQPTNILPFLFLGSQRDALSEEVINVSEEVLFAVNILRSSKHGQVLIFAVRAVEIFYT
jgi:hypothetical protein